MTVETLTEQAIDAMEAGPGMDALVALQVMGQTRVGDCGLGDESCGGKYEPPCDRWYCLPPYSIDIAAAWQVVEHLRTKLDIDSEVVIVVYQGSYNCQFERDVAARVIAVNADTAPLAICKAALKAALR